MAKVPKSGLREVHIDIGSHNENPIFPSAKEFSLGALHRIEGDEDNRVQVTKEHGLYVFKGYVDGRHYVDSRQTLTGAKKLAEMLRRDFSRAKNPAPRIGTARPRRASQITKKAPSKRLVERRAANTRKGYFPNPAPSKTEGYMLMLGNAVSVAEQKTRDKQVAQARLSYVQGMVSAGVHLGALKSAEGELIMENLRGKLHAS